LPDAAHSMGLFGRQALAGSPSATLPTLDEMTDGPLPQSDRPGSRKSAVSFGLPSAATAQSAVPSLSARAFGSRPKNLDAALSTLAAATGEPPIPQDEDPLARSWLLADNEDHKEDVAHIEQMRSEGHTASELRHLGCEASAMREAGYSARELRVADYAYEQLVDAGYSAEAIKLAGFGKASWSYGGVTWSSTLQLTAGEKDEELSEASNPKDDVDEARTERTSRRSKAFAEAGNRDIAVSWQGPTFDEWQRLLEASKKKHMDAEASSGAVQA